MSEPRDDDDEMIKARRDLEITEGRVRAQREWRAVAGIVATAATIDDAECRLVAEMGFSEAQSSAVLCMSFHDLAGDYKQRSEEDLQGLRAALGLTGTD